MCRVLLFLHDSLKELIKAIRSLHQLERDADKKQLLELLDCEAWRAEADYQRRDEGASGNNDVEKIPSISAEASPSQSSKSDNDIDRVDKGHNEEEHVWKRSQFIIKDT